MDVKLSRMIALAVLAFVLMIATVPYSEGATVSTTIDGAGYNLLDDGTATYTKAPSSTASVTVPSTVTYSGTTYTVTTIGSSAFTKNTTVASIALPSTVTSLPDGCFKNCTRLSTIDLGGVTELS
ncbi:MAG: leucine-rich repeat protein, partial [Candidatus Methanomethylophilaceae archaeon]|nr:leucine-rich repeat protein [Candidatus Methanomethylophilaceae archaeon]